MNAPLPQGVLEKERKQFFGKAAKILNLLGNGCTGVEAAKASGVDESYVSQLLGDEDFTQQVNEKIRKNFEEQSKIDENYLETERVLSQRLKSQAEFMVQPDQVLRALKFVNEAKRKVPLSTGPNSGANGDLTVMVPVTLILPQVAKTFMLNPMNEVVGIDDRELTTLPSANIKQLVEQKRLKQIEDKKPNGSGKSQDPWSDL